MKNQNNNNKTRKSGGKVLASGGFGCVFEPALKCKGSGKRDSNKVSKLMTIKHAKSEYDEIQSIKKKLDTIPNYENFFLIDDFTLCEPAKLNKEDLDNFKKCTALPKDDITKKNVNESLNKLLTLNMPNGGLPVDDYIYEDGMLYKLKLLNDKLIELLLKGILPMNQKHVYHCDIKDSNILVDDNNNSKDIKTRLIDWGLTTEYIPGSNSHFPKTWRNRPLQYNVPFSVIIFSDLFYKKYTEYLKNGGKIDAQHLRPFVVDYLCLWVKERGAGHYKFINDIMYILFSHDLVDVNDSAKGLVIESQFTATYITNYIIKVLIHFTKFRQNGTLDLRVYLDKVFIHIVDVWGFVMTYFPMIDLLFDHYSSLNRNEIELFNSIKTIFIKYLFEPRIIVINTNQLIADLKNLNKYFDNSGYTNNISVVTTIPKEKSAKTFISNKPIKTNNINKNIKPALFYFRKSSLQEREEKRARSKRRNKNLLLLSLSKTIKNRKKSKKQ